MISWLFLQQRLSWMLEDTKTIKLESFITTKFFVCDLSFIIKKRYQSQEAYIFGIIWQRPTEFKLRYTNKALEHRLVSKSETHTIHAVISRCDFSSRHLYSLPLEGIKAKLKDCLNWPITCIKIGSIRRYSGKDGEQIHFVTVLRELKRNSTDSWTPRGLVFDAILLVLQKSETLMEQLQD